MDKPGLKEAGDYMQQAWETFFENTRNAYIRSEKLCLRALFVTAGIVTERDDDIEDFLMFFTGCEGDYFNRDDLASWIHSEHREIREEAELFLHKVQKYINAYYQVERFS